MQRNGRLKESSFTGSGTPGTWDGRDKKLSQNEVVASIEPPISRSVELLSFARRKEI
jgi:hypothetical protein